MRQFVIKKGRLKGRAVIPPSKSQTLRAILFGALGKGPTHIQHYLASPDAFAMIEACRSFGARVELSQDHIHIEGVGGNIVHAEDVINAANSGIVLRFCTAIGALSKHPVVITGDYSIRHQRPIRSLLEGLAQLGVKTATMRGDGFAPVIVQGPISSGKAIISGEDSQPVSALLIASAFAAGDIELEVKNPGEKPWVALTMHWLTRLGIKYECRDYTYYRMSGGQSYEGFVYHVPGDLSSAAFPLAAALITGSEITLDNVDMKDPQGDKELVTHFQKMGARLEIDENKKQVHIKKGGTLHGMEVDINNCIDAITILAVVGCFAEGETHIRNIEVAKQKECNRVSCIVNELKKMGADISETAEGLLVKKSDLKGAHVHSYHDHRMAMSLAVAGLGAEGDTIISSIECVEKTYPSFVEDFQRMGAQVTS